MIQEFVKRLPQNIGRVARTFPASLAIATVYLIARIAFIAAPWDYQEEYRFFVSCMGYASSFGVMLGMAVVAFNRRNGNKATHHRFTNAVVGVIAVLVFMAIGEFGGQMPDPERGFYDVVDRLAAARVMSATFIALLLFQLFVGLKTSAAQLRRRGALEDIDYAGAVYMVHRATFAAVIYALTIFLGVSGVLSAIRALLYQGMSYTVYEYVAVLSAYIAYVVFASYFLWIGEPEEPQVLAQYLEQPRFIRVLLERILLPIFAVLTIVLLLWAAKTMLADDPTQFMRLSEIATAYAFTGMWLYLMTDRSSVRYVEWYRRILPIATLVILAFQARSLFAQISLNGVKTTEYTFALTWLYTLIVALGYLWKKRSAHAYLMFVLSGVVIFAMLPTVGYEAFPARAQAKRAEAVLRAEGMLNGKRLTPADHPLSEDQEIIITDAVDFLSTARDWDRPVWLPSDIHRTEVFEQSFGFVQRWNKGEDLTRQERSIYLTRVDAPIDVSEYEWALTTRSLYRGETWRLNGEKANYEITREGYNGKERPPKLTIWKGSSCVLEIDTAELIARLEAQYNTSASHRNFDVKMQDMMLVAENDVLKVLLLASDVNMNLYPQGSDYENYYWVEIDMLYIHEK